MLAVALSGAQKRRDTSPCRQVDEEPFDASAANAGPLTLPTTSIPIASQRWIVLDAIGAVAMVLIRTTMLAFDRSGGGDAVNQWYRMQRRCKQRPFCTHLVPSGVQSV